jgi:hypothetical protein
MKKIETYLTEAQMTCCCHMDSIPMLYQLVYWRRQRRRRRHKYDLKTKKVS